MRKLLKFLGWFAGGLVVVLGIAAIAIYVGSNSKLRRTYVVKVSPMSVPAATPDVLARGRHLSITRGCTECHGADFGGHTVFDNGAMGRVDGPNLTRGDGGLPANYGDEDLVRAIRHGVAMDGRGLFLMPSEDFATLTDADLGALIAYLKSLPPVNRPRGPVALGPIARMLTATGKITLAAEKIDHANVQPAQVVAAPTVEYGHYVAASCIGCHGPNLSGGKIAVGPPDWPPAANLTPHADGRIKGWSEGDFLNALRSGKRPDGSSIDPVMPRAFGQMNDTELKALYAYLQTLPAAGTGIR